MKAKFTIEQHDYKIQGHSGIGRLTLCGQNESIINKLTRKQAAEVIGHSIIKAYYQYCDKNNLDGDKRVQINLTITSK